VAALVCTAAVPAFGADAKSAKTPASFGLLQAPNADAARTQALAWLKEAGKTDAASLKAFEAIWTSDRPMLDRVADTLSLGNTEAARLLADARNVTAPAPTAIPATLKDTKQSAFYRSNLALAYAKALSNRRVHEEALESLRITKAEDVVDPSAYLFHRAVAEHALLLKKEAAESIVRLLDDAADSPERYKMVAGLMLFDMMGWKDKDLGWIARKMDNIERRLEMSRGGPQTQKMQKEVVARLDELIKELENKNNGNCNCNGGSCPNGGNNNNPNNNTRSSRPYDDSVAGTGRGPGNVDPKRLKEVAAAWGNLPPKERAKAMAELTRDMPERYREVIENYLKKVAQASQEPGK